MVSWVNDVLLRLVAIEKEAYTALTTDTVDAYPYFFVAAEKAPYWTNRLASLPITDDGSEVEDVYAPVFIARFIAGQVTSGVRTTAKNEREYELYELIPYFVEYLNSRELLQSAAYPARPDDTFRARCFEVAGFRIFENSGTGTQQYGTEFSIRIDRDEYLTQVYN